MTTVLLAGACAGLGLLLLARLYLVHEGPGSAAATLAEIDAQRQRRRRHEVLTVERGSHQGESPHLRALGSSLRSWTESHGVPLPSGLRRDLSLDGRSIETHLAITVLAAAGSFIGVLLATALLSVFYPVLRAGTPLWAGVAAAVAGALLPSVRVSARATERRRDFRHVIGSYLDLVAMSLAGGRGIPEALQSASMISDGWAMVRIRDSLETARLQGVTPWSAMGDLGADTGVDELRDLAAALALVADDGAQIRESLSARATSLRRRELADAEGRAGADSQSMLVAQLMLAMGFLVFLIYPALARIAGY